MKYIFQIYQPIKQNVESAHENALLMAEVMGEWAEWQGVPNKVANLSLDYYVVPMAWKQKT